MSKSVVNTTVTSHTTKRPGIHSKTLSRTPGGKGYKKPYRGQGR